MDLESKVKERKFEVIRSYAKIWTMPIKIYAIENTKLIVPINIWDILFFIAWVFIFIVLNFVLKPVQSVPFAVKYIILPYVFMKFLSMVKLEGKQPHKYFYDAILFSLKPKKYEYFRRVGNLKRINFGKIKIIFTERKNSNANKISNKIF